VTDLIGLGCPAHYYRDFRHTNHCIQLATTHEMQHEHMVKSMAFHRLVETLSDLMLLHQ
jgi:hypothetical protein